MFAPFRRSREQILPDHIAQKPAETTPPANHETPEVPGPTRRQFAVGIVLTALGGIVGANIQKTGSERPREEELDRAVTRAKIDSRREGYLEGQQVGALEAAGEAADAVNDAFMLTGKLNDPHATPLPRQVLDGTLVIDGPDGTRTEVAHPILLSVGLNSSWWGVARQISPDKNPTVVIQPVLADGETASLVKGEDQSGQVFSANLYIDRRIDGPVVVGSRGDAPDQAAVANVIAFPRGS